jgi:hypothetical protein
MNRSQFRQGDSGAGENLGLFGEQLPGLMVIGEAVVVIQ